MEKKDFKMEDLFLFGIGSALLARDRFKGFADELGRSREYTREEGKRFMDEAVARGREEWDKTEGASWFHNAVRDAVADLNLATREDLEQMKTEILDALQGPR